MELPDVSGVATRRPSKKGTGFAGRLVGLKAGPSFSADGRHGRLSNAAYPPPSGLASLGRLGPGHWEPLNELNQGRPRSALSFCLLASTSQTRSQQTNHSPRPSCEQLPDFPTTPFPISVSASPTKHHQKPPSYPSRLPPCCATVSAAPRRSIPPPSILRLSLPPTRVARQLIPRSSHCSTASGPDGYRTSS